MKKTTITIGIPAHNEENNIEKLIISLLSQKVTNDFTLKEIIVVCDGCTDKTPEIIEKLQRQNKKIRLINDKKRLGKSMRLNNFYKNCLSDLFMTFDADVVLLHNSVLIEIVKQFKNNNVGLVGGISIPFRGETLIQKAQFAYEMFWHDILQNINNGNNIHSYQGTISAGRSTILKKITIPNDVVADDHFVYIKVAKLGYSFRSAKKALVGYKTPRNLTDYVLQMTRFLDSKKNIDNYFGDTTLYYHIPKQLKVKMYKKYFTLDPFYMTIAVLMNIYQRAVQFIYAKEVTSTWNIIKTTK